MTFVTHLQTSTISAIGQEIVLAIAKHGWTQTPVNPAMPDSLKLIILVEEVGEVARAMTYDEYDLVKLRAELIQVAAMAAAWAQSLDMP